MSFPCTGIRTIRHAYRDGAVSNSAVQYHVSVTSFLENQIGYQITVKHYTEKHLQI